MKTGGADGAYCGTGGGGAITVASLPNLWRNRSNSPTRSPPGLRRPGEDGLSKTVTAATSCQFHVTLAPKWVNYVRGTFALSQHLADTRRLLTKWGEWSV